MKPNYTLASSFLVIMLLFMNVYIVRSQVGINTSDPNNLLHLRVNGTTTDGLQIENDNFNAQILSESTLTNNSLTFNNSSATGQFNFCFSDTKLITLNNRQLFPVINATDNTVTTTGAVDLGLFSNHFRRMYVRGIHTNDDTINGGLRINIGSSGGVTADYNFSDFAFYPVANGAKQLGRNGNFWSATYSVNYFVPSDASLKHSIKPLDNGLQTINKLKTYSYVYNSDKEQRVHYGFMAQELQKELPNLVTEADTEDKTLAVNYTELIPVLVNAIKEQSLEIEALKEEVRKLKQ